jgi:hemerythrin-like domain-containing protein
MKPIGPLMREHRLIERMVALLEREMNRVTEKNQADAAFLMSAIDFFRTYAERTHHGKEEDILFRELAKKQLQAEHQIIMDELIQEHISARKMVARLAEATSSYGSSHSQSLEEIMICLQELVRLYPAHIIKEDKHFFYPILEYFSKPEQDAMFQEFWEFDWKMIHEKYLSIVEESEKEIA